MEDAVRGGVDSGVLLVLVDGAEKEKLDPKLKSPIKLKAPVSTILRDAIMVSINHS
jgi:hypothetical protein